MKCDQHDENMLACSQPAICGEEPLYSTEYIQYSTVLVLSVLTRYYTAVGKCTETNTTCRLGRISSRTTSRFARSGTPDRSQRFHPIVHGYSSGFARALIRGIHPRITVLTVVLSMHSLWWTKHTSERLYWGGNGKFLSTAVVQHVADSTE